MNAIDYFQSYENYFWVWEDDAEVISINGGKTLAYTDEIINLLEGVALNGLPSFGSVLLAIFVIKNDDDESLDFLYQMLLPICENFRQEYYLPDCFQFLKTIQSLPKEFKTNKRKQILLQTIFKNAHNKINEPTSAGIVKYIKTGKGRTRFQTLKSLSEIIILKDLRVLALLIRVFPDTASIIKEMGELAEFEEDELPFFETNSSSEKNYVDFVEEYMDNAQTFKVATLIKPIWAGFKIPIYNAHPSEQPLGGFSDLSNKGDFDKLLVSEFANDDLIFMSRLANNEALFLHREMPPITDKLQKIILIDISLKTWGVPKILAHSISLAIAKHPKSNTNCLVYLVGDTYQPMEYSNIEEVIDGIQHLSVALNASSGLIEFVEKNKNNKQLEIFFITGSESIKNPEINKVITENKNIFKYIITTSIDGEIHFYHHRNNAFKHIQSIKLPLEKLWQKTITSPKSVVDSNQFTSQSSNLPLLLPIPVKINNLLPLSERELYFVANKCLYRKVIDVITTKERGCEILLENLPAGGFFEIGRTQNGELLFLSLNPHNRELKITNIDTLEYAKTTFSNWKGRGYKEFMFLNHSFCHLKRNTTAYILKPDFENSTINISEQDFDFDFLPNEYENRRNIISKCKMNRSGNIWKNIKRIGVNLENQLTINTHHLTFNVSNQFSFDNYGSKGINPNAVAQYHHQKKAFIFSDGSEVSLNPKGFFILKSSNPNIPWIYMPATIDSQLCMTTAEHFAGSDFFYNCQFCTFEIVNIGPQKLKVIAVLREFTGLGLQTLKIIVDNLPSKFFLYLKNVETKKMINELQQLGCEIVVKSNKTKEQEIISTREFYNKYIVEFVNQILQK